jgi:hypothetical protein
MEVVIGLEIPMKQVVGRRKEGKRVVDDDVPYSTVSAPGV